MTDARFLNNNSVTCEVYRVKCETLMQDSWAYKMFLTIVEIAQWVRPFGATIYLKVEISAIFGAAFPPPGTDWREILHCQADQCAPWLC